MNNYIQILSAGCTLLGAFLMLVSAIGIVRLPDFFIRLSAVTKTSTIGIGFILAGATFYFNNLGIMLKATGVVFFVILTSPASAYVTAKAAALTKVPFWKKTDLRDYKEAAEMPDDPEVQDA